MQRQADAFCKANADAAVAPPRRFLPGHTLAVAGPNLVSQPSALLSARPETARAPPPPPRHLNRAVCSNTAKKERFFRSFFGAALLRRRRPPLLQESAGAAPQPAPCISTDFLVNSELAGGRGGGEAAGARPCRAPAVSYADALRRSALRKSRVKKNRIKYREGGEGVKKGSATASDCTDSRSGKGERGERTMALSTERARRSQHNYTYVRRTPSEKRGRRKNKDIAEKKSACAHASTLKLDGYFFFHLKI